MALLGTIGAVLFTAFSAFGAIQEPREPLRLITAPTDYDYRSYLAFGSWVHRNNFQGSGDSITMDFTRSVDSVYFDYEHSHTGDGDYLPDGWTTYMYFNRSNTTWTNPSGSIYRPTSTAIGSNSSVGTITGKVILQFDNNTTGDYRVSIDISTTNASATYNYQYKSLSTNTNLRELESTTLSSSVQNLFIVPAGTSLYLEAASASTARYLDAVYYERIATTTAITENDDDDFYDAGVQDGFDKTLDGFTLLNGFESIVGILINTAFVILSVEVLGISLFDLFAVLIAVVGVVWILKLIRG